MKSGKPMSWRWLFDVEIWLWRKAEPLAFSRRRRLRWHLPRIAVSRLTTRLERRARRA